MRPTCKSRLKKLRQQHKLSQKGLAAAVEISPRAYSAYERGTIRVPLETLIVLAKFYDVDLNYISGVSNIRKEFPHF